MTGLAPSSAGSRPSAGARDRLIVALDLPSVPQARALADRLGDSVTFYKIGYRLGFAGGLALAEEFVQAGKKVFLDLKLHDIGNTVQEGVEALTGLGVHMLTVHAYPQTMRAAVAGRGGAPLQILAVTVLTSYDDQDLSEAGFSRGVVDLVSLRADQARACGVDGIVCAASEAAPVRALVGDAMAIVTPGIRPAGAPAGDQKRVVTPAAAIRSGADYLVVGRPITAAPDPRAVAEAVVDEIAQALD